MFGKFKMPKNPIAARSGLMKLLFGGLVAAAALGITNMVVGWKKGGFMGAIKAMFFGNGKGGLGNAIAAAFSTGATFATAGLLIGGPVGALVGGLIGMTVGAVTGFLGKEKIAKMMSGAGQTIGKGLDIIGAKLNSWGNAFARFIYTPGSAADPVHGAAVKATMFGGLVSFHMPPAMTAIGKAIGKVWQGVKDFGSMIKSAIISMLPSWLTDKLGMTVQGKDPADVMNLNPFEETGANRMVYPGKLIGTYDRTIESYSTSGSSFRSARKNRNFSGNTAFDVDQMALINEYADSGMTMAAIQADIAAKAAAKEAEAKKALFVTGKYDMLAEGSPNGRGKGFGSPIIVKQPDTNINTDQSVGAVIVNNVYVSDAPTGAADIHTLYSPSYPGGREIPWFLRGGSN